MTETRIPLDSAGLPSSNGNHDAADRPSKGAADRPGARPMRPAPLLAPPRRRRRPALIAVGLVLAATGGAVAATTVLAAGHRVAVVAVARDVPAGTRITAADLGVARVAADPALRPVPEERRLGLLGQVAAVDLRPGTLLTADMVTSTAIPGAGQAVVGVALKAGQLPARPLMPGDRVLVVTTSGPSTPTSAASAPASTSALPPGTQAVVAGSGRSNSDGSAVVDLLLAHQEAGEVAGLSSSGRLVLVLLPRAG